jgi:hypothetical protein
LDFSLRIGNRDFQWARYLNQVSSDLSLYGYETERVEPKENKAATLNLALKRGGHSPLKIPITLTIDVNPPLGSQEERNVMDFPFLSMVTVQDLPTLFAGTLCVLLCREDLKGRHWYDFLWYTARGIPVNYAYLGSALRQAGPYKDMDIHVDRSWLQRALGHTIRETDFKQAALDVMRFIAPALQSSLELWSETVFLQQVEKIGQVNAAARR